jgi:hypothetical protein
VKFCSRNRIFAFGAEEFRNLVLFNTEVEVGGSSATRCSAGHSHTSGIPISICVACVACVNVAVVVVVVVLMDSDIITSKSHFCTVFVFVPEKAINLFVD